MGQTFAQGDVVPQAFKLMRLWELLGEQRDSLFFTEFGAFISPEAQREPLFAQAGRRI